MWLYIISFIITILLIIIGLWINGIWYTKHDKKLLNNIIELLVECADKEGKKVHHR